MEQLDEYRVNLKVRNNLLLSAIENAGYKTVGHFCRVTGMQPSLVGDYVNLKRSPLNKYGDWSSAVKRMADLLNVMPEDLWTQEQTYFSLPTNQSEFSISHKELALRLSRHTGELLEQPEIDDGLQQEDRKRVLQEALESLSEREAKVLRLRFGIDCAKEHNLEEVAQMLDVTRERIRQIELSALRRLQEPGRLNYLKTVEDPIPQVDFEKIKAAQDKAEGRTMDIKDFDKLCGQHDWTYAYADDYNYFVRGNEQRSILMDYAKRDEKLMELFRLWANFAGGKIDVGAFELGRKEMLS